MNFIAIDFETANSQRSSICSLGVAVVENGKLVASDHIYIKPTPDYYDPYNTVIHGIDETHTYDKLNFQQQWDHLKQYFHQQTIVAHNAAFDCSVLRFTLDIFKLDYPDLDYHCTYRLAQESLYLKSYKLDEVSRFFRISLQHHHAESDAIASALIALRLAEHYKADSLAELSTKLGFSIGKISNNPKGYTAFSKQQKF